MRLEPASASISAKWARSTFVGSSSSCPSSGEVTATPYAPSMPRTTSTSLMFGTSSSRLGVSPSSAATIALVARFLAPRTLTVPCSGLPPSITIESDLSPTRRPAF